MSKRSKLQDKILLCAESDGELFLRSFTIKKVIDEGSSVICYEAEHQGSGRGILKEFYPEKASFLERREDGQLVYNGLSDDGYNAYKTEERKYLEPFELILEAIKKDEANELATFIPHFEIYRGCDENKSPVGTTYIWTSSPELETFEKICRDIHTAPTIKPEYKLYLVLSALETLTRCICAMHASGLVHSDIKPENFGFVKRRNDTLTQALYLFDINTVFSVYSPPECSMGTPEFAEPESGEEKPDCRTDIYSIGATLYYALFTPPSEKGASRFFSSECYSSLESAVNNSALITASEINSHPMLRSILAKILKNSLAPRSERYKHSEDLLEDIRAALEYVVPRAYSSKWVLADVERALDKNSRKNSSAIFKYHLYENPLYKYCDTANLNVTLFGFGGYGQKFLDATLQLGQLKGKSLNVTVVSDNEADREIYLKERPILTEFFNVTGHTTHSDAYGSIEFQTVSLEKNNRSRNSEIIQNLICDSCIEKPEKTAQYIFIALGDDALNLSAAECCAEALEVCERKAVIGFACEGKAPSTSSGDIIPVYVNSSCESCACHAELERMAFNVHLIWEKSLNVERAKIKANFRKPYNYESCIENAISLKYKLYSLGIDLDRCDIKTAANTFSSMASKEKRALVALEHRRWVAEKACKGWTLLDDLKETVDGSTKDEKRKKHICLVRSSDDHTLDSLEWKSKDCEKWSKATDAELSKLDELDRVSVKLHREYVRRARVLKDEDLLNGNTVTEIRTIAESDRASRVAFYEWYSCIKEIWNGDGSKVKLYDGLRDSFVASLHTMRADNRRAAEDLVRAFEAKFKPIIVSCKHRDLKADDAALINNIPFILTYSEKFYMVIPYSISNSRTEAFANVAAVTVVNPSRIIYVVHLTSTEDVKALKHSVVYMAEYMKKKHLRAAVDFVAAYKTSLSVAVDDLEKSLRAESGGRVRQVKLIAVSERRELRERLAEELSRRRRGKRLFAVEVNDTAVSYTEFHEGFDCYRFNMGAMKFETIVNCEELTFINKKPHLSVGDIISFSRSSGESVEQPEFYADYARLWTKYRERNGSVIWKSMCLQLSDHADKSDVIARFAKASAVTEERLRYILPYKCSEAVNKILETLLSSGKAEKGTRVRGYTSSSCEVTVVDKFGYRDIYTSLFADPYSLMEAGAVDSYFNAKAQEAVVKFDRLTVTGLSLDSKNAAEVYELLRFLNNNKYIVNLKKDDKGLIGFTYATRQIKELLTVEGKLLEVYVFHKLKELGCFDDVVSSYEVSMENTEVMNEFDAVVTKGFASLFIECKATRNIDPMYYDKLSGLVNHYGINSTAVLIADTQEKDYHDNSVNEMQRKRGDFQSIVTVYRKEEIDDIGNTLLKILKDSGTKQ